MLIKFYWLFKSDIDRNGFKFKYSETLKSENDIPPATSPPSPRLVSWENLQYYSAQPSVTDARQFGDKIVPTKTTTSPAQFKAQNSNQNLTL